MADLPYSPLRSATGTLPGRKPRSWTRPLISSSRSLTLASRSVAGTTTRYSRLRPAAEVSVTSIGTTLHGPNIVRIRPSFCSQAFEKNARLVRAEGLEPPRLSSREPKSRASTNSATPAKGTSPPNGQPGGAAYNSTKPLAHAKKLIAARKISATRRLLNRPAPGLSRRARPGRAESGTVALLSAALVAAARRDGLGQAGRMGGEQAPVELG